jgi:hypothetical protein
MARGRASGRRGRAGNSQRRRREKPLCLMDKPFPQVPPGRPAHPWWDRHAGFFPGGMRKCPPPTLPWSGPPGTRHLDTPVFFQARRPGRTPAGCAPPPARAALALGTEGRFPPGRPADLVVSGPARRGAPHQGVRRGLTRPAALAPCQADAQGCRALPGGEPRRTKILRPGLPTTRYQAVTLPPPPCRYTGGVTPARRRETDRTPAPLPRR